MLDRVTGMQVFARVAALGTLSAAARALGMSQTMATKHMAAIEERLGARLLHRTTRRISLTEAGRNYLEAVERILSEIDDADAAASAETTQVRGTLRLNAPVSFGIREIAPRLPGLAAQHLALTIDRLIFWRRAWGRCRLGIDYRAALTPVRRQFPLCADSRTSFVSDSHSRTKSRHSAPSRSRLRRHRPWGPHHLRRVGSRD